MGKFFPGMADLKFSVKGSMPKNVPISENFYATSQDAKLFRYVCDDYKASEDSDENRNSVIVAIESGAQLHTLEILTLSQPPKL